MARCRRLAMMSECAQLQQGQTPYKYVFQQHTACMHQLIIPLRAHTCRLKLNDAQGRQTLVTAHCKLPCLPRMGNLDAQQVSRLQTITFGFSLLCLEFLTLSPLLLSSIFC